MGIYFNTRVVLKKNLWPHESLRYPPRFIRWLFFFHVYQHFPKLNIFTATFCKFLTVPNRKDKDLKDPTLHFSSLQPLNIVISQYFKLNQCFMLTLLWLLCVFLLDQLTELWLHFLSYTTFCLTINSCLSFLFDKISASLSLSQSFQQKSKNELFSTQPWQNSHGALLPSVWTIPH